MKLCAFKRLNKTVDNSNKTFLTRQLPIEITSLNKFFVKLIGLIILNMTIIFTSTQFIVYNCTEV